MSDYVAFIWFLKHSLFLQPLSSKTFHPYEQSRSLRSCKWILSQCTSIKVEAGLFIFFCFILSHFYSHSSCSIFFFLLCLILNSPFPILTLYYVIICCTQSFKRMGFKCLLMHTLVTSVIFVCFQSAYKKKFTHMFQSQRSHYTL